MKALSIVRRNSDLMIIHDFMFDVNTVICIGNSSAVSTSKLIKITAIKNNREIKQYQEKWLQHVQRMDTNRIPKQALQYKPKGRRHIGRPRKRWRDQFHFEDTRNRNQT